MIGPLVASKLLRHPFVTSVATERRSAHFHVRLARIIRSKTLAFSNAREGTLLHSAAPHTRARSIVQVLVPPEVVERP
jgi:hypothetical protein